MKRVPCVNCGTPHQAGSPCPVCNAGSLTHRDPDYQANRRVVLATATHCHICGKPLEPGDQVEVDHVVAIASGGTHAVENLAASHRRCNRRKADR